MERAKELWGEAGLFGREVGPKKKKGSKYEPHQGKQECERRRKRMANNAQSKEMLKREPYRNKKIRGAARDEQCTLQSEFCNWRTDTTVFCHFNDSYAGKGMGQKSDDCAGFFGCGDCHAAYDQGRLGDDKEWLLRRAYYRTIRRLIDMGII